MNYKDLEKRISKLTVLNIKEKPIEIESLWVDRRIVLTFLRHFG